MTAPKQQEQPQVAMFQIISGFWISRGVFVIAKLGIPDILKTGPKTAAELASATNTHAESLFRVLRALVSVGVLATDSEEPLFKYPCIRNPYNRRSRILALVHDLRIRPGALPSMGKSHALREDR